MVANDPFGWSWDRRSARYRNDRTGQYMSHAQIVKLRDRFTEARKRATRDLVTRMLPESAAADPLGWHVGVRYLREQAWQEVERSMIAQYTFGRGGRNAMAPDDRAILQGLLRTQKEYWDRFMGEALEGRLTRDGVVNRATLYDDTSTMFYERGREQAFGITLPAHPVVDTHPTCRCSWRIVRRRTRTEATWKTSVNPCPICMSNAQQWNPYVIDHDGAPDA